MAERMRVNSLMELRISHAARTYKQPWMPCQPAVRKGRRKACQGQAAGVSPPEPEPSPCRPDVQQPPGETAAVGERQAVAAGRVGSCKSIVPNNFPSPADSSANQTCA